jgi:CBS domain-containing protein
MSNNEKLLALFREYETLLREAGKDYKQVEDAAEDFLQNRMRMVRQTRNYLTHSHDAGFVETSDKQVAFLEKLVTEEKLSGDILKKHLKTIKATSCAVDEKLFDVLQKMLKLKVGALPVVGVDGKLAGTVSMAEATRAYLDAERPKTVKLSVIKKLNKSVPCRTPETAMSSVLGMEEPLVCCTDNGKMDGKFLGVYFQA